MLQNNPYNILSENISLDNIQKMAELITLKCLRGRYSYTQRSLEKLYIGLINDLNRFNHSTHTFSDAYDLVQNAICFLLDFIGKSLDDTYTVKNGKTITIKQATYNLVSCQIGRMYQQMIRSCDLDSPLVDNLSVEIDHYEEKDYTNVDNTIELLNLKPRDRVVLDCYKYDEICQAIYLLYFFGLRPCGVDEEARREGNFLIVRNRKRKGGKIEYKKSPYLRRQRI